MLGGGLLDRAGLGARWARVVRSAAGIGALLWLAVYAAASFTGQRFSTAELSTSWQVLPFDALRAHPFRSVWYLHIQPPWWNLSIGVLARWSPFPLGITLQMAMAACGAVLAWAVASIATRLGLGRRGAVAVTAFATLNTGVLMNAFEPRYELPVAMLLAVLVWSVGRSVDAGAGRLLMVVSAIATTVVLVRSLYHPLWLVTVLALVWWVHRPIISTRALVLATAVPVVLVGGWMAKNEVVFDRAATSSWTGMNLLRSVQPAVDGADLLAMRDDGVVSDVAVVGHFAPWSAYEPYLPACSPSIADPVVATAERSPSDSTDVLVAGGTVPNYNFQCFLAVYDRAGRDARAIIRHRPGRWAVARLWSANNWFQLPAPSPAADSPVTDVAAVLTRVGLLAVPHPGLPDAWSDDALWVHTSPLALVHIVGTGLVFAVGARQLWRLLRRQAGTTDGSLVLAVAGLVVGWTAFAGVVFELGEQDRFRTMIDPLVIAVSAAIVHRWWIARRRVAAEPG